VQFSGSYTHEKSLSTISMTQMTERVLSLRHQESIIEAGLEALIPGDDAMTEYFF